MLIALGVVSSLNAISQIKAFERQRQIEKKDDEIFEAFVSTLPEEGQIIARHVRAAGRTKERRHQEILEAIRESRPRNIYSHFL